MSDRARLAISLVLNMVIAPIAMAVVPWVNSIGDHFAAAAASLSFFWPAMVLSGCVQYWSTAPAENPLARLIAGFVALPAGMAVIFLLNPSIALLLQDFASWVGAAAAGGAGSLLILRDLPDWLAKLASEKTPRPA